MDSGGPTRRRGRPKYSYNNNNNNKNNANSSTSSSFDPNKVLKTNKGLWHRKSSPKPAESKRNKSNDLSSKKVYSLHELEKEVQSQNQTANSHKFSSRNALRSSKSDDNHDKDCSRKQSSKMEYFGNYNQLDPYLPFEFNTHKEYISLKPDSFVQEINSFYYCVLCGNRNRIKNDSTILRHVESQFHIDKYCDLRALLVNRTPDDDSLHMQTLAVYLDRCYENEALSSIMEESRFEIANSFNALVQEVNPECHCRLIGSLLTGTSLKSSDINLELIHPNSELFESDPRSKSSIHHKLTDPDAEYGRQFNNHTLHYDLVPNAVDALHKISEVISHGCSSSNSFRVLSNIDDLNRKVPRLTLLHVPTNTKLEVICYADSSYKLSNLLRMYLSLDTRARILSILVKHWAKICNIANPEQGTYPPDTFIILVIYYLQRVQPPILPCLHEVLPPKNSKVNDPTSDNDISIVRGVEKLNIANLHEPERNENGLTDGLANSVDLETADNNLDQCIELGEDELEDDDDDEEGLDVIDLEDLKDFEWESSNNSSIQQLFIGFLNIMIHEFDHIHTVISIRTLKKVLLQSKDWNTQVKAIENPIKPRINISRSIGTYRTFEYIRRCFRHGYYYLTSMPVDLKLRPKKETQSDPRDYIELYIDTDRLEFYFRMRESSMKNENKKYSPIFEMIQQGLFARDVDVINNLLECTNRNGGTFESLPATIANFYQEFHLKPKDHAATTFCWLCRKIGHKRESCPKSAVENLVKEVECYDCTLDIKVSFDDGLMRLYQQDVITSEIAHQHTRVVDELTGIIRSGTGLNCKLQLFGSTVNNMGSYDSDIDICMTLEHNLSGKGINCVEILRQVYNVLAKVEQISTIEPILSARVPILKFKYTGFDVDLSMYNQCAIHNSRLLKTYVTIDPRTAQLFFLVKRIAKACGIADASRGSLSSYAWSLMVIHYLQQAQPPILPVLQEVNGQQGNSFGVNGWNVWFEQNVDSVKMAKNDLSLTQLLKGFYLYYGNFNFNRQVISIRKTRPITKFQKNWNSCMMAIEDPFELTYNLSSRLDDPMAIFIINSFSKTFKHIVKLQLEYLEYGKEPDMWVINRIFDGQNIMGSGPPYRGCRWCHRIGHKHRDCPEARKPKKSPPTHSNINRPGNRNPAQSA